MSTIPEPRPATPLTPPERGGLAASINDAHRLAQGSAKDAIKHAVQCGELLLQQKKLVKHGEFMSWVEKNCEFSQATANNYMKAAQNPNALGISSVRHLFPSGRREPQHRREPGSVPAVRTDSSSGAISEAARGFRAAIQRMSKTANSDHKEWKRWRNTAFGHFKLLLECSNLPQLAEMPVADIIKLLETI
jgi:hypothetical protein